MACETYKSKCKSISPKQMKKSKLVSNMVKEILLAVYFKPQSVPPHKFVPNCYFVSSQNSVVQRFGGTQGPFDRHA